MTAFAEKLQKAGVDTVGARLTAAVTAGLRRHPDSVVDAWRHTGAVFGHEFARQLMKDMQGEAKGKEPRSPPTPLSSDNHYVAPTKPYTPRVIPKERIEQRRRLQARTQEILRSKYKNSGGVHWSDVGWHELRGLARDGNEAAALLAAGPANAPNTAATVGAVLGVAQVDKIIAAIRHP